MGTRPRPYQKKGIRTIERSGCRTILADEMGLGKTLQTLKVYQRNYSDLFPMLVVCPAAVKWNWVDEAWKHIGMSAQVLSGRKPRPIGQCDITVINYNIATHWVDELLEADFQFMAIDECQALKNRTTKQSKAVRKVARYCPYLLPMSGTPFTNSPVELYPVLNMLWPEEFPSFFPFAQEYTRPRLRKWGWTFEGSRNLKQLHEHLKRLGMVRRLRSDVLKELPGRQVSIRRCPMDRNAAKEYRQARDQFLEWLRKKSPGKVRKAKRAQVLVRVGYLKRLAAELKMKQTLDWIEHLLIGTDEKILVFGITRKVLGPIFDKYKKHAIEIHGKVPSRERHRRLKEFEKSKKKRLCIANIQAGGVGTNIQCASRVVVVEMPWTAAELDQAICRADRMGQTRQVMVDILVSEGTIEERLCEVIQEKQGASDAILDGLDEHENRFALNDMLKQMVKEMKRGLI